MLEQLHAKVREKVHEKLHAKLHAKVREKVQEKVHEKARLPAAQKVRTIQEKPKSKSAFSKLIGP